MWQLSECDQLISWYGGGGEVLGGYKLYVEIKLQI